MINDKKHKLFLIAGFLLIIFGVGIVQAALEMSERERPQFLDLFLYKPTETNLRRFESRLEKLNWLSTAVQPWVRYSMFIALGDAGEKAVLGREGWFFYKPGVQYLIEPLPKVTADDPRGDPVQAIVSFREQLLQRGIQLLVIPAPGKASIYPHQLAARVEPKDETVSIHTQNLIRQLRDNGVEVLDLFSLYRDNLVPEGEGNTNFYLAQDTHWSPQGMRLAAQSAARRLLELGWIERGDILYDEHQIELERYGDVLRMMDMPGLEHSYKPESVMSLQVVRREGGELYKDDPESQVLVLGDSFLRIYERDEPKSGGFTAHLARELQMPVASIIGDGGASTLVRQELKRKSQLLANKKVVVWEFVERDIRFGMEGWQDIPLP